MCNIDNTESLGDWYDSGKEIFDQVVDWCGHKITVIRESEAFQYVVDKIWDQCTEKNGVYAASIICILSSCALARSELNRPSPSGARGVQHSGWAVIYTVALAVVGGAGLCYATFEM